MAAATGEVSLIPVPNPPVRFFGTFVKAAEEFYKGWTLARDANGLFIVATTGTDLLPGGFVDRALIGEDAPAASTTDLVNVQTGIYSVPMLSTSAFTAADKPAPIYFHNNYEFAKSGVGRSVAGLFLCLDDARPNHCIAWIGLEGAAIGEALAAQVSAAARTVRGVVYNNQADLAAFTVASDDGITYDPRDRVLLVGQTTAAQNGVYVVGTVASGTAPLTRAADMPSGARLPNGSVIEVSEGTWFAGSSWKSMATTTGGAVIGTNDPLFYPRVFKQTITLAAGTYTIGAGSTATPDEPLFLFSTTRSTVNIARNTANTSTATTGGYAAPVASRIAGKAGTAAVVVRAEVAAGTINNADLSTLDVLITNW